MWLHQLQTVFIQTFNLRQSVTDEATIKAKRFICFLKESVTDEATIKAKRFICFLKESRVTLPFVVKSKLVTVLSLFLWNTMKSSAEEQLHFQLCMLFFVLWDRAIICCSGKNFSGYFSLKFPFLYLSYSCSTVNLVSLFRYKHKKNGLNTNYNFLFICRALIRIYKHWFLLFAILSNSLVAILISLSFMAPSLYSLIQIFFYQNPSHMC